MDFQNQVLTLLKEEYPELKGANLSIERHFHSTDGRIYNAFLISSDKPGFEEFVAKGAVFAGSTDKHQYERTVLKILAERDIPAPRLLYPNHQPKHYLLMEFLEGQTASEALKEGNDPNQVFKAVGLVLGQLHGIKAESYGHIGLGEEPSWYEAIGKKMRQQKLPGIKPLLPDDFYIQVEKYLEQYYPTLEEDSKEGPVLIHRDAYFDNYILTPDRGAVLIDYGLSYYGRPLFDFGKPFIFDFYRFPSAFPAFLEGYFQGSPISSQESDKLRFYLAYEAVGFINFAHEVGQHDSKQHAVNFLYELVEGKGVALELLSSFDSYIS